MGAAERQGRSRRDIPPSSRSGASRSTWKPSQLRFAHVIERTGDSGPPWLGLFFHLDCSGLEPVNREAHKHSELAFFDRASLPANTVDYVRHVIHETRGGHLFSEWHDDSRQ